MAVKNQKIKLSVAIKRGEKEINEVSLRNPMGGDLRGVSGLGLIQLETDAVCKVVGRVSDPMIDEATFYQMPSKDIVALGIGLSNFLGD